MRRVINGNRSLKKFNFFGWVLCLPSISKAVHYYCSSPCYCARIAQDLVSLPSALRKLSSTILVELLFPPWVNRRRMQLFISGRGGNLWSGWSKFGYYKIEELGFFFDAKLVFPAPDGAQMNANGLPFSQISNSFMQIRRTSHILRR